MSTPNSTTVAPDATSDPARQAWRDRLANPEPIPAHEFEPPPPIAEQILSDAANHTIHLADIAAKAHTTIETLCLWLARPDIAARSDAIEAVVRRRARLAALNTIPEIIEVCATIMERYRRAPDRGPEDYKDPRTHAIQIRNAANALMAARIHIYLTRTLDRPPSPSRSTPNAPSPTPTPHPTPNPDPNPNRNPNPNLFSPSTRLPNPTLNLHDAREANLTTPNNPARDNIAKSLSRKREEPHPPPASTTPSRKRTPNPPDPIAAHRVPAVSPSTPPNVPNAHESANPPAPSAQTRPRARPAAPSHQSNPRGPCSPAPSPAATLLTIAGAPAPRSRDPTPSAR